ncbi:hypothetical protein ASD04_11315 [Devosia sp. Root436]|uniref:PfkB family carbohydrate kinase n=1 Tax=Devosia sp. Root436 TaxID=1736537 RepID=UPI0006F9FBDF|nr:PfkB family carbohydrate kinase [Devosia sp. Root436]KQX38201.1 hypothetical protein ASD04_11315 [Devosia sp. Root436]
MNTDTSYDTTAVDVVGTGFITLDVIYEDGNRAAEALGGSCGNVLISLAQLNRSVAPVVKLGLDDVGGFLEEEFRHAGAVTKYISRSADIGSPVLLQEVETANGRHNFSFTARGSDARFPRYSAIETTHTSAARGLIQSCVVFYTDRLTETIADAMEMAWTSGAMVFFEPSEIEDAKLFRRAMQYVSILKCSEERISSWDDAPVGDHALTIVTHGALGLQLRQGSQSMWCDAMPAPRLVDTSGSGDMVSVGLIDWLVSHKQARFVWNMAEMAAGVRAGQLLAATNCAYLGARGVFNAIGVDGVRRLLAGSN